MAKHRRKLTQTIDWSGPNRREVFINSLIQKNKWTVGCEVGVRTGRTLFHLLDNNPELKMYAVDKDCSQFYNDDIKIKYGDRLVVLEDTSWLCAEQIKEKIDFVFIDAGHSTRNVTRDINAFRPLLKDDKGLLGHDIDFPAIQIALENLNTGFDAGPDNVWLFRLSN